jgi:iduronate 2-sulfatase
MRKLFYLLIVFMTACNQEEVELEKPNFLFIMVDDLRPSLGTYGFPDVISPRIDQLAQEGVQFNRAYCNVPVCGASRASVFTGLRPHYPDRFVNYLTWVQEETPDILTLPEYLKNSGYVVISNGKTFHHQFDKQEVWSEPPWKPDTNTVIHFSNVNYFDSASIQYINPKSGAGPYFEAADAPDSLYRDGQLTNKTIKDLRRLAKQDKPFFLATGYVKPHLPFNVPRKYFDVYDSIQIADNRFRPENLPDPVRNSGEIFVYGRMEHFNTTEFHYEARKAYLACVNFIDTHVGIVLDSLEKFGLAENTVVVLFGDHGFHLGEHDFWGKHNILHNALHVPLVIKVPGKYKKIPVNELVEFVDIYPTICELAGLELPSHLHGRSMVPLLGNEKTDWKKEVFAEWKGARTVLSDRYSYSYWFEDRFNGAQALFDYEKDPQENVNVADKVEYQEVVKHHRQLLDSLYATDMAEFSR